MKKLALFLVAAMMLFTLAIPASADVKFTGSVEQKPAPTVEPITDENGNEVAAIIRDQNGNEVAGVDATQLTITPVSDLANAPEEIREMLEAAYEQIQQAETIDDLVPDVDLNTVLQEMGSAASVDDLVVRDVFDVSVSGAAAEYLAQDGNNITFRFALNIAPTATLLVLHNYEGSNWELIDNDRVVINADGSVDVTFDSLSPVAFVVDKTETDTSVSTDANAPTSPQTGDSTLPPVAGAGLMVLGCVAVASAVVVWKKRAQN